LDEILQHLSLALGRNIALAEIVWDEIGGVHRVVDVLPVDFTRIVFDDLDQPRILTQDEPFDGIELPTNKFIVHTPHSVSGHPTRGGLMRVSAFAFLAKNFAMKDWLIFAEVFGMPVRVARYEPSATPEEKRELLHMLQSLGTDASAIFSKAVELDFLEANRGTPSPPYESISEFMNREMSKAWLGQTLTTDVTGASGTFAAANVHNEVRHDLREDDIHKEGRTLRRDLLRPLCQLKFGLDVPVPFFRRKLNQPRDLRELADILSVAVNELSIRVPRLWAHDALGIPAPMEDQDVLAPAGGESEESLTHKRGQTHE
jgi:phage gp29-like protein